MCVYVYYFPQSQNTRVLYTILELQLVIQVESEKEKAIWTTWRLFKGSGEERELGLLPKNENELMKGPICIEKLGHPRCVLFQKSIDWALNLQREKRID